MIENVPIFYDYINAANSRIDPSTVHVRNTGLNRFFVRYLLQRAMSPLEFRIPDAWERNYFLYVLYCLGWIGVLDTDKFGVICQHCGLQGYNVYYQPTKIVVSNPLLEGLHTLEIGREAALIRLQPDYGSIMDLVLRQPESTYSIPSSVIISGQGIRPARKATRKCSIKSAPESRLCSSTKTC